MTLTTRYTQLFDDCHIPVEIEWEIAYVPDAEGGFYVVSKSILFAWIVLPEVDGKPVKLQVMLGHQRVVADEQLEKLAGALLDDETLQEACERDWCGTGGLIWAERKGAA